VVAEDPTFSDGETQAAHLLATAPRPTALFCANDLLAAGAYRAAARLGLRIPADVSVVGFADLPFAGLMAPPLTTIRQDPYAIGQAAVQRLLARCDGDRAPPIHQLIPVALTVRASTAAVRTERS
jgi:DNA-binding LacI/PurR family transcriptional regulator